jgi:hypothetical protein
MLAEGAFTTQNRMKTCGVSFVLLYVEIFASSEVGSAHRLLSIFV